MTNRNSIENRVTKALLAAGTLSLALGMGVGICLDNEQSGERAYECTTSLRDTSIFFQGLGASLYLGAAVSYLTSRRDY